MKRYESLASLCFVLPRLTGYIIANPGTVEPSLHVKNIEVSVLWWIIVCISSSRGMQLNNSSLLYTCEKAN